MSLLKVIFNFEKQKKKQYNNIEIILEKPLMVLKNLVDQDVFENATAKFECLLSKPDAKVEWLLNEKPISTTIESDSYIIKTDGCIQTLEILKCNRKNQGIIKMRAADESIETKARLTIDGLLYLLF